MTAEYSALESRLLASLVGDLPEPQFDALALEVHRFQRRWNLPLAKWCASFPEPRSWREIPAVPQAMFKAFRIACFPPEETAATFLTSGTTGEARGAHHFHSTRLYHAAALAGWRRVGMPERRAIFLTQSPEDAPQSSLASMFGSWAAAYSGEFVCDETGRLDCERVLAALGEPVGLFGTALAFLNLFEWMGERRVVAAAGSFALETGGFKGSGREITKAELYVRFERRLGIRSGQVINEYGMCELSSQFYASGLGGVHTGGPWVRAMVVSPETGGEVALGETGVLRIFDLANLGSSLAIQTGDLAVRREDGFELLGRSPSETPRGCSRMADELMRRPSARPVRTTTEERIAALSGVEKADVLREWLAAELGDAEALERFVPYAGQLARAVAPGTILHILSGNTPAAALQSLTRGLLLGSRNLCKLPACGLPEVAAFIAALPESLRCLVELSPTLPDEWLAQADAVVVFGNDATIAHFRSRVSAQQRFIGYGHKVSIGIIFDDPSCDSAAAAARDASLFDQQGCLSPHVFFVRGDARGYAARLAEEMAAFSKHTPRGELTISESASIRALRESIAFRAQNGEACERFAGEDWTVIFDTAAGFPATPLNRTIFVKPLPTDLVGELADVRPFLSACGIEPPTLENAETAVTLGFTRVCRVGAMQSPRAAWHHDGQPSLAPLVRWVDFEMTNDE